MNCPHCANGSEPEYSPYAHAWIHRLPRLDHKCTNKFTLLDIANVLTSAAQMLDVVKGEWGESWSAWDQSVRDEITRIMSQIQERDILLTGTFTEPRKSEVRAETPRKEEA